MEISNAFRNFCGRYNEKSISGGLVVKPDNIFTGLFANDRLEAVKMAGRFLFERGYVERDYINSMVLRELSQTTYLSDGVAIPHGENKDLIKECGVVILIFPEGVSFLREKAYLVIGIAAKDDVHIKVLSNIASIFMKNLNLAFELRNEKDPLKIFQMLLYYNNL